MIDNAPGSMWPAGSVAITEICVARHPLAHNQKLQLFQSLVGQNELKFHKKNQWGPNLTIDKVESFPRSSLRRIETARQSSFRFAAITLLSTVLGTSCYADDLIVEKKTFSLPSYTTVAGETIKSVKVGWESAGTLNSDKSNAVLIHEPRLRQVQCRRQGGWLLG
jgi:hypothetical protein